MERTRAGLWIDRSRAVIVRFEESGPEVEVVQSDASRRVKGLGGARSHSRYGPQDVSRERTAQVRQEQQLRRFYGNVISRLSGTRAVLVIGPGLTKHQFARTASHRGLVVACVKASGPLTDKQLVAEVREFFRSRDQQRPNDTAR